MSIGRRARLHRALDAVMDADPNWIREHGMQRYGVVQVPLSKLSSREAQCPKPDRDKVERLKALIQTGKRLPYIEVKPTSHGLSVVDGHHRTQALKELGRKQVPVLVFEDDLERVKAKARR